MKINKMELSVGILGSLFFIILLSLFFWCCYLQGRCSCNNQIIADNENDDEEIHITTDNEIISENIINDVGDNVNMTTKSETSLKGAFDMNQMEILSGIKKSGKGLDTALGEMGDLLNTTENVLVDEYLEDKSLEKMKTKEDMKTFFKWTNQEMKTFLEMEKQQKKKKKEKEEKEQRKLSK
jgi:hypothetical protein